MNNIDNTKPIYKLGKSFRAIGSWLIWGTISFIIFMILSIAFWSIAITDFVSVFTAVIMLTFLGASLVFITLLGIYTIKMIVRGYKTAVMLKVRKYKTFSKLNLISLITSSLGYISIIIILIMITTLQDPVNGFYDSIDYFIVNPFLFLFYLGTIAGSILRMIAWYHLKTALILTSNDINIQISASKSTQMFVAQIFLGICGPLVIISMTLPSVLFMAMMLVLYATFYIIKITAYRSIGKHLKMVSSDSILLQKSIITKQPQQYMQVISNNSQNNSQNLEPDKLNNIHKESTDIFCHHCGASNPEINAFCLYCGEELK